MRYKVQLLLILSIFSFPSVFAQNPSGAEAKPKEKGSFYFTWGYNKDWFSKSDLHFESDGEDNYSFTLYDVTAKDLPKVDHAFDVNLSIPQYVYRFGYYFGKNKNLGIELAFDHAKYIMVQNQTAHVKGTIHGEYMDKDTVLGVSFVKFEHTNGANFLMLNLMKRHQFLASKNNHHRLQGVMKPGLGIVIPQSDVSLFGHRQNNYYHIAGYIFGLDLELRYEFRKHIFVETGFKGTFANYTNVLTVGDARANHHFWCMQYIGAVGYQIAL